MSNELQDKYFNQLIKADEAALNRARADIQDVPKFNKPSLKTFVYYLEDGPIVDGHNGARLRVTEVTITVDNDDPAGEGEYVFADVKGRLVKKDGTPDKRSGTSGGLSAVSAVKKVYVEQFLLYRDREAK